MQRFRLQLLEPPYLAAAWFFLLGATALLAIYGANVADASWEVEVTRRVQSASPDALHQIARFMTVIGRSPISTIIPVAAIAAMWVWGQRHLSIFLAGAAVAPSRKNHSAARYGGSKIRSLKRCIVSVPPVLAGWRLFDARGDRILRRPPSFDIKQHSTWSLKAQVYERYHWASQPYLNGLRCGDWRT